MSEQIDVDALIDEKADDAIAALRQQTEPVGGLMYSRLMAIAGGIRRVNCGNVRVKKWFI